MDITASKMYASLRRAYDKETMKDIVNHGCSSGAATQHIYYRDTCKWYKKHEDAIWELAIDMAEECGNKNVLEFLGTFSGAENVGSADQFKNLMCWFAVEECCRARVGDN
jgi:hypothetical protein